MRPGGAHDSVRILADLQACQSAASKNRGVGRYASSLVEAWLEHSIEAEIFGLVNGGLPTAPTCGLAPNRRIRIPRLPAWGNLGLERMDVADRLVSAQMINQLCPDVFHVSHVFEGLHERVALPRRADLTASVVCATLFDLIPLRFEDQYLADEATKRWYHDRTNWLAEADLLLSISESSRQDAIDLLDLDPEKIVTIHGGIDDCFVPPADRHSIRAAINRRFGLQREHFVLYTGGDDHRKNLDGLVRGLAAVAPGRRSQMHLVIVCQISAERKSSLQSLARSLGLSPDDVLFTGYVTKEDLVAAYQACDLFVFPSLYEGLGLPVLEAMACGAPVIGGNNSSIAELIQRPDALFDAADPTAIARIIERIIDDPALADELRTFGLNQHQQFSWAHAGQVSMRAIQDKVEEFRQRRIATIGGRPVRKLAMFTPLPPARSGIADYNHQFLPYLTKYFEIDVFVDGAVEVEVPEGCPYQVLGMEDLPEREARYDAFLYEVGNSEFHTYMLSVMQRNPGVVCLHDAFLSGLAAYRQFNLGMPNVFFEDALYCHSTWSRRYMAEGVKTDESVGEAIVELPFTKGVIDAAIGVISHSPFNLEVARTHYPNGWAAPYRIIPQMVEVPTSRNRDDARLLREKLGVGLDDFVVATFGHITWTKWGDRLLEAFETSKLSADSACHLIFAGEMAEDGFGQSLTLAVAKSTASVRVTGFLDADEFEDYLSLADLAVQLRQKSRGGTPKGVLDCLARGVPVVVNNDASYQDYPDDVVCKLAAAPTIADIRQSLERFFLDSKARKQLASKGLEYVSNEHSPQRSAAMYAAVIDECYARYHSVCKQGSLQKLANEIDGAQCSPHLVRALDVCLEAAKPEPFKRPQVFLDVSHLADFDHETGIQRVVKETVKAAYRLPQARFDPVAVRREDERLVVADELLDKYGLRLPHESQLPSSQPTGFAPGDHLLMLDSSWERFDDFQPAFAQAAGHQVPITTVVYDILPVSLPAGNFVDGGREWFQSWLDRAISRSDNLMCISRAVADELINYIQQHGLSRRGLNVGFWHLGANLPIDSDSGNEKLRQLADRPYILMVGTIEPRKNHGLALRLFTELWRQGEQVELVIVGKTGWMVDEVIEQLGAHEQLDKRLHRFEGLTDGELAYLYENALGNLLLSKGEGFGLPLVEASLYDVPTFCSDIPVFREVAGRHATYGQLDDFPLLLKTLEKWLSDLGNGDAVKSGNLKKLSWEQSTERLLDVVTNQDWYFTF